MLNKETDRQMAIIATNTVDLISKEELRKKIATSIREDRPLRVKYGADPSAPDIHLGHSVGLNKLRQFQDLGHKVIFLIGDFTGMIGDPSGRSETRKPLTREEIAANAETYKEQAFKILNPEKTEIRFNSEWNTPMRFEQVLKLSAHATVAQMLARDDFQKRFQENQPISLVEFLYPLIQGYDSVAVKADVELGGTDQLFNLLVGRSLQKAFDQEQQIVMTLPLIPGLDGIKKMSKSLGNYVGITEAPNEMFGKLMSVPDELVESYLTLVLGKSPDELERIKTDLTSGKLHPRDLKDSMAKDVVEKFHDAVSAGKASEEFKNIFADNKLPNDIPTYVISHAERKNGKVWIVTLLVRLELAQSNGAARRLIAQGGVRVGGEKITDDTLELELPEDTVVQVGKRGFAKVVSLS
ncbi:MAG: tyrosine--tRNA ligase [Lentisphaerae bacterium]|nr:tyrosine--tRNA ligase [Lentisphaerota bacterium]